MKHSVNELYHLHGKSGHYTLEGLAAKGIPAVPDGEKSILFPPEYARRHSHIQSGRNGYIKFFDGTTERFAYMYGEQIWFDTEAERDAYRAGAHAENERMKARNRIKREVCDLLDSMSLEEMEKALEALKRGV